MKKLFNFILLLTLISAIVLSGCGGNTTVPVMFSGSVSGIVVKDKNKEPIEGAKVSIGNRDFITKADGMFRFDGVSFDENVEIIISHNNNLIQKTYIATDEDKKNKTINIGMIFLTISPTIYIAGYDSSSNCYWTIKNNEIKKTNLGDGSSVKSIFVSNNTVYTAGSCDSTPCYWTGDKITKLDTKEGEVKSIFVSNNTVYTAGVCDYNPCYWINNKINIIPKIEDHGGEADAITVFNNKIYVAGQNCTQPYFYTDGNIKYLSTEYSYVNEIYVDNNNVYICGSLGECGGYWLNNIFKPILIDGKKSNNLDNLFIVNSTYVSKGKVYSVGFSLDKKNTVYYWIDDKYTELNINANFYDLFVLDGIMYIAGYIGDYNNKKCGYWIIDNGSVEFHELSDAKFVDEIFVVE